MLSEFNMCEPIRAMQQLDTSFMSSSLAETLIPLKVLAQLFLALHAATASLMLSSMGASSPLAFLRCATMPRVTGSAQDRIGIRSSTTMYGQDSRTKRKSKFAANGGFLYCPSFLSPAEFEAVRGECRSLYSKMGKEDNVLTKGRLGLLLDHRSLTHKTLLSEAVAAKVSRLVGLELQPSDDPVTMCCYRVGSHMDSHRDDAVYDPPETAAILTLENTADYYTEVLGANGHPERIWTEPNSLLLIRAGPNGPLHRVSRVKRGERVTAYMIFSEVDSLKQRSDYYSNWYPVSKGRKKRKAR